MSTTYGPNHEQVAAFVERVRSLTPEQVEALAAAQDATWRTTRIAVWDAAVHSGREDAWDAALESFRPSVRDAAPRWARDAAWSVTVTACGALVVRDLITPVQFDTLYSPWASVMEGGQK